MMRLPKCLWIVRAFACLIFGESEPDLFVMFNAAAEPVDFSIPHPRANKIWRLAIDTSRPAPEDLYEAGAEPSLQDQVTFRLDPRSSAIFLGA